MSRYTSTSEFDINRRVQITNETPVLNLFEALNSAMQNDFYEWIIGNEEVNYNVPYSIKQENPNGEFEDNSLAGTVGRFNIIRDEQESDGKTQLERLERNGLYFKSVNGKVSEIYGPRITDRLDGPKTMYHSKKISGVILPEYDLLLHHFYRYLEALYPDHPDWTYLLTPTEMNDAFRAAGKIIDYQPKNIFFDKVARSLSKNLTRDEQLDEATMIKIHNLKDEAFRRKFYGTYAGYKMIGNDIFQHISVFPVATYLPVKPLEKIFNFNKGNTLEEANEYCGTDFKTIKDFDFYDKTQRRIIDTFSSIYSNKFKLIDYEPKSYGNFVGFKTFKFFTTLWSDSVFEAAIEDFSKITLQQSNISQTAILKDDSDFAYYITNCGYNPLGVFNTDLKKEDVDPIEMSYFVDISESIPKTTFEFEVFDLMDSIDVTNENDPLYNIYQMMIEPGRITPSGFKDIYSNIPRVTKKAYINPLVKDSLYLDPITTLGCYKTENERIHKNVLTQGKDFYKIYKTKETTTVNAALRYSFTPGFLKMNFNESVETTDHTLFNGLFAITILNRNNEEFVVIAKGNIAIQKLNDYSVQAYDGDFRIISIPEEIERGDKIYSAFTNAESSIIENSSRFYDESKDEILIDRECKVVRICKLSYANSNVEYFERNSSDLNVSIVPFFFNSFNFTDMNFGWGNFLNLIDESSFNDEIFDNIHYNLMASKTTLNNGGIVYPITSNNFINLESDFIDNNASYDKYLYARSEFGQAFKDYINSKFETLNLYPSDSQTEILIEGVVDLVNNDSNVITFTSETSKERMVTLSIGDIISGSCVDNDDESVYITEIGPDFIKVSNDLIASGTFDFKFNTKISAIKITEDNPMSFVDRLKSASEYEFYNPFEHGIYGYKAKRFASKAYVNGLSNINSWRPYSLNGSYGRIVEFVGGKDNESTLHYLPSTVKFMNELFVEYNADKILNYPTRNGSEECLMSVDWLDYLEEKVNESSRLSDKTSVGVCLSLQTDMSGEINIDTNVNSKFRVLPNIFTRTETGDYTIPAYVRLGTGNKNFKATSLVSDISNTGKSVFGKSIYSKETSDFEFKENVDAFGNVISPTMDYYGDNDNLRAQSHTIQNEYIDIDNSIFEISFGENDIIQKYNVDGKYYTLAQVNICKQSFKNLLKYSTYNCIMTEDGDKNRLSIDKETDKRWLKSLNINDAERNIFIPIDEPNRVIATDDIRENPATFRNTPSLPNFQGIWTPSVKRDENGKVVWDTPSTQNISISIGNTYYWLIIDGGSFEIDGEKIEISDSAILLAYVKSENENDIVWSIKNIIYCNNFGGVSEDDGSLVLRHTQILNNLPEDAHHKELEATRGRIKAEDVFIQFILQSLGVFENEETIKQCVWDIKNDKNITEPKYNEFISLDKFELNIVKDVPELSGVLNSNSSKIDIAYNEALNLFNKMGVQILSDDTEIEEIKNQIAQGTNVTSNKERIIKEVYSGDINNLKKFSKYSDYYNTFDKYILRESNRMPMSSIRILDLKKTVENATEVLYSVNFGEIREGKSISENYASIGTPIFEWDLNKLLNNNIFLFTTNDLLKDIDSISNCFEESDIIAFFKIDDDLFGTYKLNKFDTFSAEIPVERFSSFGVSTSEWNKLRKENYCSIGISKNINSTFELPRKYLNDDYEFDIIVNPHFIGAGYEYSKDENGKEIVIKYNSEGAEDTSLLKSIEISKGAIYFDKENNEFYTWTYEVETDRDNKAADSKDEVLHKSDEIKKYAIRFEENKYFKNVLFSSGAYKVDEVVGTQNELLKQARISTENELSLNLSDISAGDKILEVREVKLRPLNSNISEATFLSNYSTLTGRVDGIDFDNNKIIFEPHKISEKSKLLNQNEVLLPCHLVGDKISTDELPEGGIFDFENGSLNKESPILSDSKFERLPVLSNEYNPSDSASAVSVDPDFEYYKNNLIFIGRVNRKKPNKIIFPNDSLADTFTSAIGNLSNGDRLVAAKILTPLSGVSMAEQNFVVNNTGNLDNNALVYFNTNSNEFVGFLLRNGTLSIYTQQSVGTKISFHTGVEIIPNGSFTLNSTEYIESIQYNTEKDSYILKINGGVKTVIEVAQQSATEFTYKKAFGTESTLTDFGDEEIILVEYDEEDAITNFDLIKVEDIKDTSVIDKSELKEIDTEDLSIETDILHKGIEYIDSNNPTAAFESMEDEVNPNFVSNNTGFSMVDSVYVEGNNLFIYSNLYKVYPNGYYSGEFTQKKFWHKFDLSTFVNNSENYFRGKTLNECKSYTSSVIDMAEEIVKDSDNSIKTFVSNLKNRFNAIDDWTTRNTPFNISTDLGIYKGAGENSYVTSGGTPFNDMSAKQMLGTLCEILGATECVKSFISTPVSDAFIKGEYLFIKEISNKINYIKLDKLYKYEDISNIENWNTISIEGYTYDTIKVEGISASLNGTEFNIPARVENSIFNTRNIEVIGDEIYLLGNVVTKNVIENLDLTSSYLNPAEVKEGLKSKNTADDNSKIIPLAFRIDFGRATEIPVDSERNNDYLLSVKKIDDTMYFYSFNAGNQKDVLILNDDTLESAELDSSDSKYKIGNSTQFTSISDNGIPYDLWITRDNKVISAIPESDDISTTATVSTVKDNEVTLSTGLFSKGPGDVNVLFSFSTKLDIQNTREFVVPGYESSYYDNVETETFNKTFEIERVNSFQNADKVFSFNEYEYEMARDNEEDWSNDIHYYPFEIEPEKYYKSNNFLNSSGNPIVYCGIEGVELKENTLIAKEPKYFSSAELNADVEQRIEIEFDSDEPSISNISKFVYSSEPFLALNGDNLDYFKDYLVSGEYEMRDYLSRNYSNITNVEFLTEENEITEDEFLINGVRFQFQAIDDSEEKYLKNIDNNYFVIDSEIFLTATIQIPYLFNTKTGNFKIDTDFDGVANTDCTGIYLPKNGYGSYRGNNDEWIYNKPWDIDSGAFDLDNILESNKGPVYLVNKFGEKIVSKNGYDKFSGSINQLIRKSDLGDEKYRNIVADNKSVILEKIDDSEKRIYFPFIEGEMFNGFVFKIMKDGLNILNNENIDKLSVKIIIGESEIELEKSYANNILTLNFKDMSPTSFGLKFEFEDLLLTINDLNLKENVNNKNEINRFLDKDVIYFFNKEREEYSCIINQYTGVQGWYSIGANTVIDIDSSNKVLVKNGNFVNLSTSLSERKDAADFVFNNVHLTLNISYIQNIEKYIGANEVKYLFDDTLISLSKRGQLGLMDIDRFISDEKIFDISEFPFIDCTKISSSGVIFNTIISTPIYISGIESNILMKKPKYKDLSELINEETTEIGTGKILYHNSYKNSDLTIKAVGNSSIKLNQLIYKNQENVENKLNDGNVHFIKMKLLTAKSILPSNDMLFNDSTTEVDERNDFFIEIDNKDLIEWPADRVFFNKNGISEPPVKIGSKVYRNESYKDYKKVPFKNNNGYKIFECDEFGHYTTYNSDCEKIDCTSVLNLFNPNEPRNEINSDSFRNSFYKEGNEANPFWQIIRIKKDFDELSGELKESSEILEYRKYSNKVGLYTPERPFIKIKKTSSYETKEEVVFLNKNVDFVNKKKGELKFASSLDSYEYYRDTEDILKYGIKAENTLMNKIKNSNFKEIKLSSYEKCNFIINSIGSNKLNNDDSIIEISELGLFDKAGRLMAYATFPPIEYRSDSQHISFLLYIYNGIY